VRKNEATGPMVSLLSPKSKGAQSRGADPFHLAPQGHAIDVHGDFDEVDQPRQKKAATKPPAQSGALRVLQCAAEERLPSKSSRSSGPYSGSRSKKQQPGKTDTQEERRLQVLELIRRQKKYESHCKRQQRREARDLGDQFPDEEDERRRQVKELKSWLKQKDEQDLLKKGYPMEKIEEDRRERQLVKAASKGYAMDKLYQDLKDSRERRSQIGDQKRQFVAMNRAAPMPLPEQVVHRHVHHHVHSHREAGDDDEYDEDMMMTDPGHMHRGDAQMMMSASMGDLRGGGSQVPTAGMPWRPLVHSASAGQTQQGFPMPPVGGRR